MRERLVALSILWGFVGAAGGAIMLALPTGGDLRASAAGAVGGAIVAIWLFFEEQPRRSR